MKKIGIVGYIDNIKRIMDVIESDFPNIIGHPVEIFEVSQVETTVSYLKEHIDDFDGVLFTGKTLYTIMNHNMHSKNPWVSLESDDNHLQRLLLKAQFSGHQKINHISIDGYTKEVTDTIFKDFGLEINQYKAHIADVDILSDSFLEDLYTFHKSTYERHKDILVITEISVIHKRLNDEGIPCQLLTPNHSSIASKINALIDKMQIDAMLVNQIVVMSIDIDIKDEYDLTLENEYSIMLNKAKVSEEVYKFAQRIQAAVIETSNTNYLLFTTKHIVEYETNNLKELSLLRNIKKRTRNTVSVGIGFGATAREAKSNAMLGKNKAIKMGGHQGFVVYGPRHMDRIVPTKSIEVEEPSENITFKTISENSGVSTNTIYQLKTIMELYKKDTFTSYELAEEFGNSLRSMNRIIEKLELSGYVDVVGKKIVGKAGRPSRILKIKI